MIYALDSLTIIPGSVSLREYPSGKAIEPTHYQVIKNQIHLTDTLFFNQLQVKTYTATYRVLPYDLYRGEYPAASGV